MNDKLNANQGYANRFGHPLQLLKAGTIPLLKIPQKRSISPWSQLRTMGKGGCFCLIQAWFMILLTGSLAQAQWTILNSGTSVSLNEIHFPVPDTGYVVGEQGTVLRTWNGGIVWNPLNTRQRVDFHELKFISAQEGWIVGDSGTICKTMDGGESWTCQYLNHADSISLHAIEVQNSQVLWVGGFHDNQLGYLAKSVDGGQTWVKAQVENYLWAVDITKIAMINPQVGYASTRGNILKTIDGGLNWRITDTATVATGSMFSVLEDIACFPGTDTVYTCGWYPPYFGKTYNGASQWQHRFSDDYTNLDFINSQVGYVGGWGVLHKTINGGQTFMDASGGSSSALFTSIYSIDFTDEWTGYACGAAGKIIKTANGGTTSVNENSSISLVNVYPNPTNGRVQLSDWCNIRLYDLHGRLLEEINWTQQFDISSRPKGIYIMQLMNKEGQLLQVSKLIKH